MIPGINGRPVAVTASINEVQARVWGLFDKAFVFESELSTIKLSRPIYIKLAIT
jgi:hypothetical protein